jgi:single-stranded DNA-binding protein
MPTVITASAVIHLYGPAKTITGGQRTGAAFSGYHKARVKKGDAWEDEFTSVRGVIFGKEGEWLARDARKGSLVFCAGAARVEKYEKDGKHGATLIIDCQTARVLDRKEQGEQVAQAAPAPAPARTAPATSGGDDGVPF